MKRKRKIVFIIPRLNIWGGAEKIIHTIINHMDFDKYDITLILFENKGDLLKTLDKRVNLKVLNVSKIRYNLLKLLPYLHKYKPDIVFTGWGEVSAYLAPFIPLFPKTKFVARETNIVSQHVTRKEILFFYKFYNNFNHIIAQSKDMKSDLIENFKIPNNKLILINNPIDFNDLEKKTKQEKCPKEFNTTSKNVVAVGNVSYRKGFDNLLKVFTYLKEENIHLHIIGEGPNKETFMEFKEKNNLEKVHFLGKKLNPYPYLKYADLFVLSSRYEGFPNVLLEAGAVGTYSLANDCKGGINEIIVDGQNGEIANIENHQYFAEKIKRTVNQKYDSEKISKSIKERFGIEVIIPKYLDFFDSI